MLPRYVVPALALALFPAPVLANDDDFELWINPSLATSLDGTTELEVETAQRLRDGGRGRSDTYYLRLWLNRDVSEIVTLSGAIEQRINTRAGDETRLHQQLSARHGSLRGRLRLEQRFAEGGDRMGLRLRPRIGLAVPIDRQERWSGVVQAEAFLTLRSTDQGGDGGLTGLRTQIGVEWKASERATLSLGYLRQQAIEPGEPDEIGHAPILGVALVL